MTHYLCRVALLLVAFVGAPALGQDAYYRLTGTELAAGGAAEWPASENPPNSRWSPVEWLRAYAALEGGGEAYVMRAAEEVGGAPEWWQREWPAGETILVARAPQGRGVAGRLFVPDPATGRLTAVRFSVPADRASAGARRAFFLAKALHYERLQSGGYAGAAWFRRQAAEARRELANGGEVLPLAAGADGRQLDDTYDLFTGGRAVSENLQLHRELPDAGARDPKPVEELVSVESIEGITVREMDWSGKLAGATPALDPLAAAIPADQHAVFFPTFEALASLLAEVNDEGLPVFRSAMPRAEDAGILARYERQLCLSTRGLARLLGPLAVKSVVVTGSDPYFPTGTDIAVILETRNPEGLKAALLTQVKAVAGAAAPVGGQAAGLKYEGFATPDRAISTYIATLPAGVVVTNSAAQLERLGAVASGQAPNLGGLLEYRFFRSRYPLGTADETAFVFLSDATIRRWCGPRWRIGASRRLRAGAILADVTASHMDDLAAGAAGSREVAADTPMRTIGSLTLGPGGVSSSVYGSLRFITPIAELDLSRVTADEKTAYERWRTGYQRNWSWAFDPIGVSIHLSRERASADMTIMPLIAGSEYRQWMAIAQGAAIAPDAGDPHDSIMHGALAINAESPMLKQWAGFARSMMTPQLELDPLGWLGQSVALYADADPFWADLAAAEDDDEFMGDNAWRLPVGFYAEASSPLKLTAFVAAVRGYIDQSAPGMAAWEPRQHGGQAYVKVGMSEQARAEARGDPMDQLAVYYAAMPRALIVSINEEVLKRAIDRELSRGKAGAGGAVAGGGGARSTRPWLGSSLCLRFDQAGVALAARYLSGAEEHAVRRRAWADLPILTEWKRRYPEKDPVALHRMIWGTTLLCPAGGTFEWNEEFATMASTVCGHPGAPPADDPRIDVLSVISGADFGLTFEGDGLRARAVLNRTGK